MNEVESVRDEVCVWCVCVCVKENKCTANKMNGSITCFKFLVLLKREQFICTSEYNVSYHAFALS